MKCPNCGHVTERAKKTTLPESDFDQFWLSYPRKTGKHLARKIWKGISGDKALVDSIIQAVQRQRRSTDWTKDNGAYIPHASTWLNQRRWEDEVPLDGKIVHPTPILDPLRQAKEQSARDRLEAIREKEFQKRELARLAQERDDARSRRMMESTGEKYEDIDIPITPSKVNIAMSIKDREYREFKKSPAIPVEIRNCRDENGIKWVEEMERRGSDEE